MGKYKLITTWAKKVGGPVAIIASLIASGIAMNFVADSITKKMYPEDSEETNVE